MHCSSFATFIDTEHRGAEAPRCTNTILLRRAIIGCAMEVPLWDR